MPPADGKGKGGYSLQKGFFSYIKFYRLFICKGKLFSL